MAVRIETKAEPLPGYRLLERLGGGGFGEVWKCEAPGGLHKAIKFVFGDLAAAGEDGHRAEQELKALSRVKTVRHPYILSLERYDIIDGQLMIVMELADRNLWDRFKECRARGLPGIPREELLGYLAETAEALDLMNQEYQLQHLDIKPQNLFLVHNHVKVADFGLVKDLEGVKASVTGGITPAYAAPETFDGWISPHCDQYSLAIVYQELLTGERPFAGTSIRQLILQHIQGQPKLAPLPASDQPAIARALLKTPGDRFPSCRDLVAALKNGYRAADQRGGGRTGSASCRVEHVPTPAAGTAGSPPASSLNAELDEPATACLRLGRQVEDQPSTTPFLRSLESSAASTQLRQAPVEINGNGVLFPALVLGLGQLGTTVVQRLRQELHLRWGGMDRLPHLRFLVVDTDLEMVRAATRGSDGVRLAESEVLLAPLHRPSHYVKARDGRTEIESWLPPRMLYRIPRSQETTGVRALGRLALCDNYRLLTRRLQSELNACMDADALNAAVRQTGLGLRSNRLRVYLITSLAGGTGSGMFLDLAYTVRALLKQAGYSQPDLVGLFLLPHVDRNRTQIMSLGNACAALRELRYFARPDTTFTAKYHPHEPALCDSDPPFARSIILPLPDETDESATRRTIEEAGLFLARDLCSPLGPTADLSRAGLTGTSWESRGLFYQTFGLYRLSWPRHELLRTLARRLCHRLVQRWMSKDSKPIREAVRAWVEEQWMQQELGSSVLMERLGEMTRQALGQDPEEIFRSIVQEASGERGASALSSPSQQGANASRSPGPAPEQIRGVLEQFEQLLGKAQEDGLSETPARLVVALREAADQLVHQCGQKLAELPVRLIEAPQFRLAGAEEAVRQMVASLEQTLRNHEPLACELSNRAVEMHNRLVQFCASQGGHQPEAPARANRQSLLTLRTGKTSRKKSASAEVQELLHSYPKALYQSLLLRQAGNVFLTLRGHLADEMREINFCRLRLGELLRMLEQTADSFTLPSSKWGEGRIGESATGKHLYPTGCKNFQEMAAHFEDCLKEDVLNELDECVQAMLQTQFTALVKVCLDSGNVLKNVEAAMRRTAEKLVAERLGELNVVEMFLEQHDAAAAVAEIADFFDKAAPQLPSTVVPSPESVQTDELCVLAAPSGPAGERLRALAAEALPEVEWQAASSDDDILLYRERANLPLSELPQLGPLAQDAYRQMSAAEHFTPHCRCDVDFNDGERGA